MPSAATVTLHMAPLKGRTTDRLRPFGIICWSTPPSATSARLCTHGSTLISISGGGSSYDGLRGGFGRIGARSLDVRRALSRPAANHRQPAQRGRGQPTTCARGRATGDGTAVSGTAAAALRGDLRRRSVQLRPAGSRPQFVPPLDERAPVAAAQRL